MKAVIPKNWYRRLIGTNNACVFRMAIPTLEPILLKLCPSATLRELMDHLFVDYQLGLSTCC